MNKDFYLTLLSNSSFTYFPENRTSNFKVHLSKEVNLEGQWQAALSELSYPHTIYNVTGKNNVIFVKYMYYEDEHKETNVDKLIVPEGYYSNLEDLLKAINEVFHNEYSMNLFADNLSPTNHAVVVVDKEKLQKHCQHSVLSGQGREIEEVEADEDYHFGSVLEIMLEGRLAIQLGFAPTDNLVDFVLSPNAANINFGLPQQIFVYIDIIEPQIISDYCVQVIKIVKTLDRDTQFSDVVSREILNRNYMPLNKRRFQTISIDLRDSIGDFIPFRSGTSIVTVHFKKLSDS